MKKPTLKDAQSAKPRERRDSRFLIELINVSKFYGKIQALKDINLKINKGEFISLVGPSGAGKSTLVRLLIREEKPTAGEIWVGGINISQISFGQLPFYRRRVGVVFQDYKLLPHKTVFENVAFALEAAGVDNLEIKRKVPKILELVDLKERGNDYPDILSGGEKQRISIARAIANSPRLLIADEPTGNLDPHTTWDIIDILRRINTNGTTVLLATHNKAVVDRIKKRVVSLKDGKIILDQKEGKYLI
ncbi:cell division ATP-binding protein FtsE [Candidatus Berkelbacteria bacterium]|nr:cell division ATP-binding protein FtsE [Candidatus Berkelbacteria bacterium]